MKAKGEQYVVYDRHGNKRPLIGVDAVDYQAQKGESYGIEGPNGFTLLDDNGGKAPKSEQHFQLEPKEGDKLGSLSTQGDAMRLDLFAGANLSTILHETAHAYLHILRRLTAKLETIDEASRTAGQKGLIDDFGKILKFIEAESPDKITADQHEKFAKAFETYLQRGIAPTPELASTFGHYRTWLVSVYKKLDALGVDLSPEMVDVFDRLVAGEDAITAAREKAKLVPLFATASDAGMNPIEWARYQKTQQDAHERQKAALTKQLMHELTRERTTWWKARKAEVSNEVTAELKAKPEYQALEYLQKGLKPDGTVDEDALKIDKKSIVDAFGKERLEKLPRPYVYQVEGGVHVDMAAELLGFSSADELLSALERTPKLEGAVEAETRKRMLAQYGNMRMDGTLRAAAEVSVEEHGYEEILNAELKAIAKKQREVRPFVAGARAADAAEERSARAAMRQAEAAAQLSTEVLRQHAEARIAGARPRDIRPDLYWTAAQSAALESKRALDAGRYEDAVAAKQKQRIAVSMHRAAVAALEFTDKLQRYARRLSAAPAQERLGLAGESYQAQVNALLNKFEFTAITNKALDKRQALNAWVDEQKAKGYPLQIPAEVLEAAQQQNYREVKMETLRDVNDALVQIESLARLKNKLLAQKDARDFETRKTELLASIDEHNPTKRPDLVEVTAADRAKLAVESYFGAHTKISTIAQGLDGNVDGGPMWDLVVRPLNEAADAETARRTTEGKKLEDIISKHYPGKDLLDWHTPLYIPEIGRKLSKEARLAVALNYGNETSRDRILSDPKRKWNEAQTEAILNTLDKRDLAFVQDVFDFVNAFWPEISDKNMRVIGTRPEKVEPLAFTTRAGTVKGGYYPLAYDTVISDKASRNDAVTEAKQALAGAYLSQTTRRGHLEQRVAHNEDSVRLDLGVLFKHVDQVIHDLTHHEALVDVTRILKDPGIRSALHETIGPVGLEQFQSAFDDIAASNGRYNRLDKMASYMKNGAQIAGLGLNIWTAAQQPLGIFNGMARVGPVWVMRGVKHWLRDAASMENTVTWIHKESAFMRSRSVASTPEIGDLRNKLAEPGGWFDSLVRKTTGGRYSTQHMTDAMLYHIGLMQMVADVPTWLGQYEKMSAQGKSHEDAVVLADQAVRDAQGGGQTVDLAAVQRMGPFAKLFMVFYSYGNTVYNATQREITGLKQRGASPASVMRFTGNLSLIYLMPAFFTVMLGRALKGDGGDDDNGWEVAKDVVSEMGATGMNTMVFVREFAGLWREGNRGYEGPAGTRLVQNLYKAGLETMKATGKLYEGEDVNWDNVVRTLNAAGGPLFHYPAAQVQRTMDGWAALSDGTTTNPGALIFGPPRKQK